MTASYLKRQEVGYPQQSNPREIYAVKIFEDADLAVLQNITNAWLFALPSLTNAWIPHVVDTQLLTYGTGVNTFFVMKITVYVSGTVVGVPF